MISNNNQQVEAHLVALFREAFGADLASVVAYGSYVAGQWAAGSSDINLLVLVETCDPAALARLGAAGKKLLRKHRVTPLILTVTEFSNSADVFPMEYMDIIARHRVLHGGDPTGHVRFARRNLRHQLEHQLRGSLISLRQLVVAARGRKRLLAAELKQITGSMSALFRGLLRLHGVDDVPVETGALIRSAAGAYGFDPDPFLQLHRLRAGKGSSADRKTVPDSATLAAGLLTRMQELIVVVDSHEAAE